MGDAETVLTVHASYQLSPNIMTVITREGTHALRWEGWLPRCWATRVSEEFFVAALKVSREGLETKPTTASVKATTPTSRRQGPIECTAPRARNTCARPRVGS